MSTRDIAQQYINQGFDPTPVKRTPNSKAAYKTGWNDPNFRAKAADFAPDDNIGFRTGLPGTAPGGILVDGDIDTHEAAIAADLLVPESRATFGRAGKPNSHRFYVCDVAPRSVEYVDLNGKTILELRAATNDGKAMHTVVPPSVWCDKDNPNHTEQIEGVVLNPAKADADDLALLYRCAATATLLAQHYPTTGHDARMALAGYLLQTLQLHEDLARRVGLAVIRIVQGNEPDWRLVFSTTVSKFKAGDKKLVGVGELKKLVGEDVIARLNEWWSIKRQSTSRTVRLTSASDITPEPVDWIWDQRIPKGSFGLLGGREGLGKSLISLEYAAKLTQGTLEGIFFGNPRSVIIAASEDSWAHVIAPRLLACEADMSRIFRVDVETTEGIECDLTLPVDILALQQAIFEQGDVALLILDPVISRLSGKLDTHKDAEVRKALDPLVKLAEATGAAILGLIHVNKSQTSDPLNSLMGSRAFTAVSRYVLFVIEDPNDESTRLFGQTKNNLGPSVRETLAYTVESQEVLPGIKTGKIMWGNKDPRSIREILQENAKSKAPVTNSFNDQMWLRQYLHLKGGSAPYAEILEDAEKASISEKRLRKAATDMQVTIHRKGFGGSSTWALPGASVNLAGAGQP